MLREQYGEMAEAWNDPDYIPKTAAEYRSEKRVTDEGGLTADDWLAKDGQ